MLTIEMLKAVPSLKDLDEAALTAITTLSANDENAVIAQKVKEIHDQYDIDIKLITGREKPGGMKTYDHLKQVLADLKKDAEKGAGKLQEQLDALTRERDDLTRKIKEGATDGALKGQLEKVEKEKGDLSARITALQKQLGEEKAAAEAKLAEALQANVSLQVDFEFQKGIAGAKFKDEKTLPKEVRDIFIEQKKGSILARYKPDWIEKDGVKIAVFRDANGMIVNNPANLQNPFTPGEMLLAELQPILDAGKHQPGAGTGAGWPGQKAGTGAFSGTGVRSKTEATKVLREHLFAQGLTAGTEAFQEAFNKEWTENKFSELPLK